MSIEEVKLRIRSIKHPSKFKRLGETEKRNDEIYHKFLLVRGYITQRQYDVWLSKK